MNKLPKSYFAALLMSLTLVGCQTNETEAPTEAKNSFEAGTYTGTAMGNNGEIKVEVEFSETEILSVKVLEHHETEGLAAPAIERIPSGIVENQTLAVDTVSGATNVSNGILDAVADCVTQAGGDVESLKVKQESTTTAQVEEITTDVVVVGAGASGSAAAVAASEAGANVILLEKAPGVSGAGSMAGVIFADHSSMQVEANDTADSEWLYETYIKESGYFANSRLVRAIINKSASTIDWLLEQGVNLNLLEAGHGAQYNHVGMPTTAHGYADGGTVAIQTLHDKVVENGGTVMYETPGESLIMDDSGKVTGVVARRADGTELRITADSVILSTGGYGGNAEMMKEHFGEEAGTGLIATATGDGLEMAWSAGAAELGTDVAQWFGMTFEAEAKKKMQDSSALTDLVRNPLLFVNNKGYRFGNEEEAYESAALSTMIYTQPDAEMYIILDQGIVEQVAEKGLASVFADRWGHLYGKGVSYIEAGHLKDIDKMAEANRAPFDYSAVLADAVQAGVAFTANSIEELAELIGAPYLVEEVANYNQMANNGEDTQFFKDSKYMYALEKGPYYAVKVKTRCLGTLGGVAINENIQAVDESGTPIDNLWVTGADAGGMYGNNYVTFEGGTLGFAYNSGRIAGENAAANALSK
ncbi:FAD-dependent oxidoreductase [Turicibacter sp. TJ11]|uniref:FAD-dependent oxidoreductase n=1 Tax=Turicibacter sp. TJ11 TaxID=2806443 RepID=UPI001F2104DD|nr:FAD-dependent oxidoreductase [Turicibacter sp. TJ11]